MDESSRNKAVLILDLNCVGIDPASGRNKI